FSAILSDFHRIRSRLQASMLDDLPIKDLRIIAYDYEPLLTPNDLLGEVTTDAEGYFRIAFEESKFSGFLRHLMGTPGMRLEVNDGQGNEILETKLTQSRCYFVIMLLLQICRI
ncbi:MAG: transthyretin-like family protein, partial [Thermoproteota archaeon]|nr:transthyretin-like family protein [Thermoproteota archaeon]